MQLENRANAGAKDVDVNGGQLLDVFQLNLIGIQRDYRLVNDQFLVRNHF